MPSGPIDIAEIRANLDINSSAIDKGLAQGRNAIDAMVGELKQLDAELKKTGIGTVEHAARTQVLNAEIADLTQRMNQAYSATTTANAGLNIFNARVGAATQGAGHFARGLMQVAYAVDDIQYGFASIVNNVGPAMQALGPAMGLTSTQANMVAASMQIAAVAANVLYKEWDHLKEAFGAADNINLAIEKLDAFDKRLKKLKDDLADTSYFDAYWYHMGGGTTDTAGDFGRMAGMEKRSKERHESDRIAKEIEGRKTDVEKKEEDRFKDAVHEAGKFDDLKNKVAESLIKEGGAGKYLDTKADSGMRADWDIKRADGRRIWRSKAEEYNDLKSADRSKLTDDQKNRLAFLEAEALHAANEAAREMLGTPGKKDEIARRLGGDGGGLISGRLKTEKEKKAELDEARKIAADKAKRALDEAKLEEQEWQKTLRLKKEEREREQTAAKATLDLAHQLLPSAKVEAADDQVRVDQGKMTDEQAQRQLSALLREAGMSDSDATEAAKSMRKTAMKGTPEERRRAQIQREIQKKTDIEKQAKDALGPDKDPKHVAEQMVAEAVMRGGNLTKARTELRNMLKAGGMDEDKIGGAADDILGKANKSVGDKMRHAWNHGMDQQERDWRNNSRSMIGNVADMTARVQSGVVGKDRAEEQRERMQKTLDEIRDNGKGTLALKVTP